MMEGLHVKDVLVTHVKGKLSSEGWVNCLKNTATNLKHPL